MASQDQDQIEMSSFDACRLLAAAQALCFPSKFFRVTHKEARKIIVGIVGFCPPGKMEGSSMESCLSWLGLAEVPE